MKRPLLPPETPVYQMSTLPEVLTCPSTRERMMFVRHPKTLGVLPCLTAGATPKAKSSMADFRS
jgi:hypothetical protein